MTDSTHPGFRRPLRWVVVTTVAASCLFVMGVMALNRSYNRQRDELAVSIEELGDARRLLAAKSSGADAALSRVETVVDRLELSADARATFRAGRRRFQLDPTSAAPVLDAAMDRLLVDSLKHMDGVRDRRDQLIWLTLALSQALLFGLVGLFVLASRRQRGLLAERTISEERFLQIAGNIREMFWLTDVGTNRILYMSPAFEALFGMPVEALYADRNVWASAIHPDDMPAVKVAMSQGLEQGRIDIEYRILQPGGGHRWLHASVVPIRDETGRIVRMAGVAEDVSARHQAESDLFDSRERLRMLVEHAPAALAMFDTDMRYLAVSEQWAKDYGTPAVDMLGRSHYEVFPDMPDHWRLIHSRALAGEVIASDQDSFLRPDGRRVWLKWEVRPWHGADGRIGGISIFTEDTSARIVYEAALLESETRFRQIAETIHEVFWLTDPTKFEILYLSPAYESVWGRPCSEAYASPQSWMDAIHPDDRDRVRYAAMTEQVRGTYDIEYRILRPDGTQRWIRDRAFPVRDESGQVHRVAGVAEDITAEKDSQRILRQREREILGLNATLETRIRERTDALEAANRDLEAFSYSVSHDLRGPLRAIDGFLSVLAEDGPLNDVQRDAKDRALRNVLRMNQLIGDLMSLARVDRQSLVCRHIDLADLAASIIEGLLERDPERQVEVRLDVAEAFADPELMRIALENLLGNAWKFTSKQAAPSISFGVEVGDAGQVVYVVRDNGAGFDPARASRLFQPFQRLHSMKEFEGTGIGLATVERIIRRHGGRIWADAAVGQGATFRFTLGKGN